MANQIASANGRERVPFVFVAQWPAAAEFFRRAYPTSYQTWTLNLTSEQLIG